MLMRHAGPARLMWSSDWPFVAFETSVNYTQMLENLKEWVPDPVTRSRMLSETPSGFYFE